MSTVSREDEDTVGQDNFRFFGLDVQNSVFVVSSITIILFMLVTMVYGTFLGLKVEEWRPVPDTVVVPRPTAGPRPAICSGHRGRPQRNSCFRPIT